MRVTRETRERTRKAILEAAQRAFRASGFAAATTRQIAREAGIAAGTLFNYFPSKEALGLALLAEAAATADAEFTSSRRDGEALEEALFALVAIQLRHFEPYRAWVSEVVELGWSPLRNTEGSDDLADAGALRRSLLERVGELRAQHARPSEDGILDEHLFWTLYLGTLAFWARDDSEHQQATLALLDRSMGLYGASLRGGQAEPKRTE